jgi:TonB family protein
MAHDVFISYSKKDKAIADAICAALENEDLTCWYAPRDVEVGGDWDASIMEALATSRVMILVWSANSDTSRQVKRELAIALDDLGVSLIPFRTEIIEPSKLRYYLGNIQWLDASAPPLENNLRLLIQKVRASIARINHSQESASEQVGVPEDAAADIREVMPTEHAAEETRLEAEESAKLAEGAGAEEEERQRVKEEQRKADELERQRVEAETRKREEAEARQREEAETRQREEAETRQREEAETRQREEAEARQREEAETRQREEAEARQREEAEARQREEAEARQREEADARQREEAETRQREEAEARQREEAEARQREEAEARQREEAETRQREEAEARQREEAEARQREEAEARQREEAEARQREEAEARQREEAEARQREEAEARQRDEAQAAVGAAGLQLELKKPGSEGGEDKSATPREMTQRPQSAPTEPSRAAAVSILNSYESTPSQRFPVRRLAIPVAALLLAIGLAYGFWPVKHEEQNQPSTEAIASITPTPEMTTSLSSLPEENKGGPLSAKASPTPRKRATPERSPTVVVSDDPPPPPKPKPTPPRAPISGGVLNGKAISLPKPAYPPIARQARASGQVVVQVTIDENGSVISAHAVSGHPLLQAAATAAARGARFSPTKLSGQPVKVTGVIQYNFVAQ